MIGFSFSEIFLSVIYSVVFGVILAFGYEFYRIILFLPETISLVFKKTKFQCAEKMYLSEQTVIQKAFLFFVFTLGVILLSYFALDGAVRIYVIILTLLSFLAVRRAAFYSLEWAIYTVLSVCFYPLAKLWRKKHL